MKYYGDVNKNRLVMIEYIGVGCINDPSNPYGFINKQGKLFEFCMGKEKANDGFVRYLDCSNFKRRKYKGNGYYEGIIQVTGSDREYKDGAYAVFKILPRISNDDTFKWKDNPKYGTKETVIIQENFEFNCIVKADGDAIVDVRYTKCDNKHRNKVTISRIEVYNAANEEILNAIKEWIQMFKREMTEATDNIAKFRKTA